MGCARIDLVALRGTLERSTVTADRRDVRVRRVPSEVRCPSPVRTTLGVALREEVRVAEAKRSASSWCSTALRGAVFGSGRDARGAPSKTAAGERRSLDRSAVRRTAFNDEQGRVSSPTPRASACACREAPGYAAPSSSTSAPPRTLEIVLRRGVIVEGRVTAVRGRRPVEGATVSVIVEGCASRRSRTRTDCTEFATWRPAPYASWSSIRDYAGAELTTRVESTQRDDRPYELKAIDLDERGAPGRVVDPEGRPAPARASQGAWPGYLPVGAMPAGVAISDANGAFTLRGHAPVASNRGICGDFGRGSVTVQAESGRATKDVEIRLPGERAADESAAAGGVALTLGERGDEPSVEVVIVQVSPGSEAERAGVTPGDVLVSIDGHAVRDMKEARTRLGGPVSSDVVLSIPARRAAREAARSRESGAAGSRRQGLRASDARELERDERHLETLAPSASSVLSLACRTPSAAARRAPRAGRAAARVS